MNSHPIAITLLLVAASCVSRSDPASESDVGAQPDPSPAFGRMADSLDRADVGDEIEAALRRDDRRLLGVMGYALMLPGVPEERYQRLKDSLGVRVLEYTSDAQHMGDHARYNAAAARYADRYNRELLRRIDAGCAAPPIDMSAWVERGGRAFTIQLPSTFTAEPAQGVDSEVGRWTDGRTRISYDYGAYSDDLSEPGTQRERRVCEVRIGGRPARVVIARGPNGEYIAEAHWPNLRTNAVGRISLTVSGTAADPEGQRTVLVSLWSVRIRD